MRHFKANKVRSDNNMGLDELEVGDLRTKAEVVIDLLGVLKNRIEKEDPAFDNISFCIKEIASGDLYT